MVGIGEFNIACLCGIALNKGCALQIASWTLPNFQGPDVPGAFCLSLGVWRGVSALDRKSAIDENGGAGDEVGRGRATASEGPPRRQCLPPASRSGHQSSGCAIGAFMVSTFTPNIQFQEPAHGVEANILA
jgi:hypothetical protein